MITAMTTLGFVGFGAGCSGGDNANRGASAAFEATFDQARVEEVWVVKMAASEDFAAYTGAGWVPLVVKRDLSASVRGFAQESGLGAARAHADTSLVYRQAALMAAHGLVETYGKTPEPTDPLGTAHLLTVSFTLLGDIDAAKAQSAKLAGVEDPTNSFHAPWKAWLDSGAAWPPPLASLPGSLPEVAVGGWPEVEAPPHYVLPEREGSDAKRDMGDPGILVALALWHEAAARLAAGESAGLVDVYQARYRWPVEPGTTSAADLPMPFLFGSDYLVPADGPFIEAALGKQGLAAVDAFAERSMLAWMAQQSRVDGKISAERAIDVAAGLRDQLLTASQARSGGNVESHHRTFADIAHVGALRNLALLAEAEGDREEGGKLRLAARDLSDQSAACPVGLLSLAAWDTSNRYPTRALEIVHRHVSKLPALEIARYGLDVMALRVSRERAGELPGM